MYPMGSYVGEIFHKDPPFIVGLGLSHVFQKDFEKS